MIDAVEHLDDQVVRQPLRCVHPPDQRRFGRSDEVHVAVDPIVEVGRRARTAGGTERFQRDLPGLAVGRDRAEVERGYRAPVAPEQAEIGRVDEGVSVQIGCTVGAWSPRGVEHAEVGAIHVATSVKIRAARRSSRDGGEAEGQNDRSRWQDVRTSLVGSP
ncbi:MAG: hypothetical protein KDA22_08425, partial [Phycisphaerales bacterium]|nr:hypothetical protein [Phycisphaerales bacterium]